MGYLKETGKNISGGTDYIIVNNKKEATIFIDDDGVEYYRVVEDLNGNPIEAEPIN